MSLIDFIQFIVEHWIWVLILCVSVSLLMYWDTLNLFPALNYDVFHFYYAFNLGISYGLVLSLYIFSEIETRFFLIVFYYAIIFHFILKVVFKKKIRVRPLKSFMAHLKLNKNPIKIIYIIFSLVVLIQFFTIGVSAFTETNRFEDAKGVGFIVRILEPLKFIVVSYIFLQILELKKKKRKILLYLILFVPFCIFLALLSGAKFALIELLLILGLMLPVYNPSVRLGIIKSGFFLLLAISFVLFILHLNNRKESQDSILISGAPVVLDKLVMRVLSDGDMYYMSLPNGVIDDIQTDNLLTRIFSQVFGNSTMSKIAGYDVSRYPVGKAIQLYHHDANEIAGGPVSHIDLFSYKYLGLFLGIIFMTITVLFYFELSFSIVSLRTELSQSFSAIGAFNLSIYATVWIRSMAILMEPPVGIAYVIDLIVLIVFLKILNFERNK